MKKKIVVLGLVMAVVLSFSGCDMMDSSQDGYDAIESVENIDSFKVDYGTSADEVIDEELPEEVILTLDDGSQVSGDVSWEAPDNYNAEEAGTYEFEGKATYEGLSYDDISVDVEVVEDGDEPIYYDAEMEIVVEWDELSNTDDPHNSAVQTQNDESVLKFADDLQEEYEVNQVGARIDYIEADPVFEDAHFSQSTKKEGSEEHGIINFNLPQADSVNLYTIAVHVDESGGRHSDFNLVYYIGKHTDIKLSPGRLKQVEMEDFEWHEVRWELREGYEYQNLDDGFKANFNKSGDFFLPYEFKAPFEDESTVRTYTQSYGRSSYEGFENDWSINSSITENPGEEKDIDDYFQPYYEPDVFGFSDIEAFHVPPLMVNDYEVEWRDLEEIENPEFSYTRLLHNF